MRNRSSDVENIWLAWDGEDQAILGYSSSRGHKLVKQRKNAVVLCHLKNPVSNEGNRSGSIIDSFEIKENSSFFRILKLPQDTDTIELLVEDGPSARPLKTFKLLPDVDETRPASKYGNVVIALPDDDDGDIDGRYLSSEKRIQHLKNANAHIGWAGYFNYWSGENGDESEDIVKISRFHLEVPHFEDALQIYPVGFDIVESELTEADDNLAAISTTSLEHDSIQSAVLSIEGSPPLLRGLYFMHVSVHRVRANEWSDVIDIDPGTFQLISDNLVEAYQSDLSETGDWDDIEIKELGRNLIDTLTNEHRWFELSSPDYFVDVENQGSENKVKMSAYEISAGDHLVFYDTMGRNLRAGQYTSKDNILAFEVSTHGLKLLRGVYTNKHKKITEIDANRPAKGQSASLEKDIARSLPVSLRNKHNQLGAESSPFDFLPLKVFCALENGLHSSADNFPWGLFSKDPAAWLLAHKIQPGFWRVQTDLRPTREGNLLDRALNLLNREAAFEKLKHLEDQLVALFVANRFANSPALNTCIFRINGLNPVSDDIFELAESVEFVDKYLGEEDFKEWMRASRPELFKQLYAKSGQFKPIEKSALEKIFAEIRDVTEIFKDFHKELTIPGVSTHAAKDDNTNRHLSATSEEMLEGLVASLLGSNLARDKVSGGRYQELMTRYGKNAYFRSQIAADIYKKHPKLLPNDSKKLIELLRELLRESNCNYDARNFDETNVENVASNMQIMDQYLLPNALEMRNSAQIELDNASLTSPTDEQKKAAIIEFASAHEMQKTWNDIQNLVKEAEQNSVKVPKKLRRLQLLWPRESATTLNEYLAFEQKHRHILGQNLSKQYGYDPVLITQTESVTNASYQLI